MSTEKMLAQMSRQPGFIAALDQSGGSTPGALRLYGIPDTAFGSDAEMFRLIHEMRVRIMTAPAFTGAKIIGAILFEGTMDGLVQEKPVPAYLWNDRGVVPFVKVDQGLEPEQDGVRLMRPMPSLDATVARAVKLEVFGTKMRSVINLPSQTGIGAVVRQQFEIAERIARGGLMPIIEPEVLVNSPDKAGAEAILREELTRQLDTMPNGRRVMLKLTIPENSGFLCIVGRPCARGPCGRAVRRVLTGESVRALGCQSRYRRQFFTRPGRGSHAFDDQLCVRCRACRVD